MKMLPNLFEGRMYSLLACDYDGTLTDNDRLSPSIEDTLRRVRTYGIKVALITGRRFDELLDICPQVDLFDLVVAENGALMYQPSNGELLFYGDPPPDSLAEALTAAGITFFAGRVMYAIHRIDSQAVQAQLSRLNLNFRVLPNRDSAMILPEGVDKGAAIIHVTQKLNLDPAQAIAIGDGENDLEMFKVAGFSVAPANAIDKIKSRADIVYERTAGEAVEEFVKEFLSWKVPTLETVGEFVH